MRILVTDATGGVGRLVARQLIAAGHTVYIGLSAVIINLVIAVAGTLILRAAKVPEGTDETLPHQYTADPTGVPAPEPAGVGLTTAPD